MTTDKNQKYADRILRELIHIQEHPDESYSALMGKWLPASGRELRRDIPCIEIYRSDPNVTPPEELVTDILIALI